MIRVNDKISFHSEWSELTTTEFLKVIEIIATMYSSPEDMAIVKLKIFGVLANYKRSKKRYTTQQQDEINNNIAFLADQIRFPFKYFYKEPSYFEIDNDLRFKLRKYHPSEIYSHKLPSDLNPQLQLDLFWRSNPLPYFRFNGKVFTGPLIEITKQGILNTSITARQYATMVEVYNAFLQSKDVAFLYMLLATLYTAGDFTNSNITSAETDLKNVHISIVFTAFYLTQNLLEFLTEVSPYKILFNKGEGDVGKLSLGAESTIYNLAKAGYGTEEQIAKTTLINFLNMQVDHLQSFIANCRSNKMSDTDISTQYKIPFSVLEKL